MNSLKIISGSRRYCLLKTLKITTKTTTKTNQRAICFDEELKKFLRPEKTPLTSKMLILTLGVQTRNGRHFLVPSKQDESSQDKIGRCLTETKNDFSIRSRIPPQ